MKTKQLKLDWDQLEEAFNNQNEELVYFLDLVDGQVHLEGEDEDDDTDDETYDPGAAQVQKASNRNDATRAYVEPPDTAQKVEWLKTFVTDDDSVTDELREALTNAMGEDEPTPAIRGILNQNPDVRDRWYLYRTSRIQELIAAWITKHKIEPSDSPPWD